MKDLFKPFCRLYLASLLVTGLVAGAADTAPRGPVITSSARSAALAAELTGVDVERQTLAQLLTVAEQVLQAFELGDTTARYGGLQQAAVTLHRLGGVRPESAAGQVRAQLEKTLVTLKDSADIQVFQVLDEQKKWKGLQERIGRDLSVLNRRQDALRLVLKSALDDTKRLENLLQAEFQLLQLLRETPRGRARSDLDVVRALIDEVPPPALFVNGLGFDLVRLENNSGYISKGFVTWKQFSPFLETSPAALGSVATANSNTPAFRLPPPRSGADQLLTPTPWTVANLFCRWVSTRLQVPYELPPLEAVRSRPAAASQAAEWTGTPWRGATDFERDMLDRFGVKLYTVWQPGKEIAGRETFGELPFAWHPAIGFRVFTRVESVKAERIERLRRELNLADESRKPAPATP